MPRSRQSPELARLIGSRIRLLREATGITQERFAWACEIDKGYFSHIEAGRNLPSVAVLATIAGKLGVHLIDLVAVEASVNHVALLDAVRMRDGDASRKALKSLGIE